MKLSLLLVIGILPFAQLFAESEENVIPVYNFVGKGPSYGYEAWEDLGAVSSKTENGWTIDGPANGGFGIYFNDLLDLESATKLHVKLMVNTGNTGDRLMLKFHSADGKQAVWYVPLKGLEPDQVEDITIDLTNPEEKPQEEPIDMGIIKQIQVQGTFTPGSKYNVTFVSLGAEQK